MDHAIPINKARLGEHRIGNLVPCCQKCNAKKGGNKDFREFLEGDDCKTERISAYMHGKNYTPVGDNEQVKILLECAYKEVAAVAARYATIINVLLSAKTTSHDGPGSD